MDRASRARIRKLAYEAKALLAEEMAAGHLDREAAVGVLSILAARKLQEVRGISCQTPSRRLEPSGTGAEPSRTARRSLDAVGEPTDLVCRFCPLYSRHDQILALVPREVFVRLRSLFEDETLAEELGREEVLGWLYQYFNEQERMRLKKAAGDKVSPNQLALVTQVYTPRWIVDYLVENTLGRLWLEIHPDSRLRHVMRYLVPEPGVIPYDDVELPHLAREITVFDPACGTMNFGLAAFDLLYAMYEEELERAGEPGWPQSPSVKAAREIPESILANNLFGVDIDPWAIRLAQAALCIKARSYAQEFRMGRHNLVCPGPFDPAHLRWLGALAQPDAVAKGRTLPGFGETACPQRDICAEDGYVGDGCAGRRLLDALTRKYWVVVTNPPYLDARDYRGELKEYLRRHYPRSKRNIYAVFIERALEWLAPGGRAGLVTPQTFMFIAMFSELREYILARSAIESLIHMGLGAFSDATVDTAAFVLRAAASPEESRGHLGVYFRLLAEEDKQEAFERRLSELRLPARREASGVYVLRQDRLESIPGRPWVYWVPDGIRRLFEELPSLGEVAEPKQGLATGDNARFVRFWWEVGMDRIAFGCASRDEARRSGKRWFPYMKGGDYNRWYGNQELVVNWEGDGAEIRKFGRSVVRNQEYYFRPGVTWSLVSSKGFSARINPGGFIHDVGGMCVFTETEFVAKLLLGLLNSRLSRYFLGILNPTVNHQIGDISRLPVIYPDPSDGRQRVLVGLVERCIEIKRRQAAWDETTWDFVEPAGLDEDGGSSELADLEAKIDDLVFQLYGVSPGDRIVVEAETDGPQESVGAVSGVVDRSVRWVSYAVGLALGRFARDGVQPAVPGFAVLEEGHPYDLAALVERILLHVLGPEDTARVLQGIGMPLRRFLERDFFPKHHVPMYRRRPVYWRLMSQDGSVGVYVFHERMNAKTLRAILEEYVEPKLQREAWQLPVSRPGGDLDLPSQQTRKEGGAAQWENRGALREDRLAEAERFARAIRDVLNAGYEISIDDGIPARMKPLSGLIR